MPFERDTLHFFAVINATAFDSSLIPLREYLSAEGRLSGMDGEASWTRTRVIVVIDSSVEGVNAVHDRNFKE